MALIGKIRKRAGLLVGVIGLAMLLFILNDFFSSNKTFLSGNQSNVGEIADEVISFKDFEQRVEQDIETYKSSNRVVTVDNETKEMIRQQAWSQILNSIILNKETDALGIKVTSDELFDMVQGNSPHALVQQSFANPQTGVFDRNVVINYLQKMDSDPSGVYKAQWLILEKELKKARMREKYYTMIKKGLYATTLEAKDDYVSKNQKVGFSYIVKRYTDIADTTVTITDDDLESYYDKHKKEPQYKQEASRSIEYVAFDVLPSPEDTLEAKNWMDKLYVEFKETDADSAFVMRNAENPVQPSFYAKGAFPIEIDSLLFVADTGSLFGPYLENGYYKIAKLMEYKYVPDSVKARHILIKIADGDTVKAMYKADSLKTIVKKQKNFAELAKKHSEDFGSAQEGGDLGWFTEGAMVKPFNDACFDGKKGDLVIVVSPFGIHLIEVLDKSKEIKKVKVGVVDYLIKPGKETYDKMYEVANAFSYNDTPEKFQQAIEKQGLTKLLADYVKEDDKNIAGIGEARQVIRWMYQAEKGKISAPFELENKYIIAHLYEIREKGIAPLSLIKENVKQEVMNEKKAELIIEKMKGTNNLNDLANKLGIKVEKAENVIFSSYSIPGIGAEKELLGNIFSLKQGETSIPIKGKTGVFVISIDQNIEPPETTNYTENKDLLIRNKVARVDYEVFNTLKDKANVIDNRAKFY